MPRACRPLVPRRLGALGAHRSRKRRRGGHGRAGTGRQGDPMVARGPVRFQIPDFRSQIAGGLRRGGGGAGAQLGGGWGRARGRVGRLAHHPRQAGKVAQERPHAGHERGCQDGGQACPPYAPPTGETRLASLGFVCGEGGADGDGMPGLQGGGFGQFRFQAARGAVRRDGRRQTFRR